MELAVKKLKDKSKLLGIMLLFCAALALIEFML